MQSIDRVVDVSAVMQRQDPMIHKVQKSVEVPQMQVTIRVVDEHAKTDSYHSCRTENR